MLSIRTQDKMCLIPYNSRIYITIDDEKLEEDKVWEWNTLVTVCEDGFVRELGKYKTKERALEVLDEIEKHVMGKILISTEYQQEVPQAQFTGDTFVTETYDKIEQLPLIYHMPIE